MNPCALRLVCVGLACVGLRAADYTVHSFRKIHLDKYYWSEGANFGDLNRDGKADVISGPYWWEAPDFTKRHEIYPPKTTFVRKKEDGTEERIPGFEGALGRKNAYSTVNADGWNDVLTYGLPGTPAYLYLNPKGEMRHWERHQVFDAVDNESPTFADLTGDGKPEIICNSGGTYGYASPNWNDVTAKWVFTAATSKGPWGNFNHGLGFGDVNGDGRMDLLERSAWWEQPAQPSTGKPWKRHPAITSPGGGAQMFAYDVNDDGRNDIVTSLAGHGYGLAWFEQLNEPDGEGHPRFRGHVFMDKEPSENRYGISFSQLHAVELVDVDGDGLKDIITGKCFWAHGPSGDPDPSAPAVLYWFRLVRGANGKIDWVPHLIDDDSGVGRQIGLGDPNGDGKVDIVIGNKKGTFLFMHETRRGNIEQWARTQPVVKFPDAKPKEFKLEQVIQRTGPPRN
jgi:hypothetical protein